MLSALASEQVMETGIDQHPRDTTCRICEDIDELRGPSWYKYLVDFIRNRIADDQNGDDHTAPPADTIMRKTKCQEEAKQCIFCKMRHFADDWFVFENQGYSLILRQGSSCHEIRESDQLRCDKLGYLRAVIRRLRREAEDHDGKRSSRQQIQQPVMCRNIIFTKIRHKTFIFPL